MSGEVSSQSLTLKVSGGTYAQSDVGTGIAISSPTFDLEEGADTSKVQQDPPLRARTQVPRTCDT